MFHATAVPSDPEHTCVDVQNEISHSNTSYLVLVFRVSSIKKINFLKSNITKYGEHLIHKYLVYR